MLSKSKKHIDHKKKMKLIASMNKRDLQKVDPKKISGALLTQGGGFTPHSNPHGDLTAQVDPRITLCRGQS